MRRGREAHSLSGPQNSTGVWREGGRPACPTGLVLPGRMGPTWERGVSCLLPSLTQELSGSGLHPTTMPGPGVPKPAWPQLPQPSPEHHLGPSFLSQWRLQALGSIPPARPIRSGRGGSDGRFSVSPTYRRGAGKSGSVMTRQMLALRGHRGRRCSW